MSSKNPSSSSSKQTYFYVFVDKQSWPQDKLSDALSEVTPDQAVLRAFEHLSAQGDASVEINPSDDLRKTLGIESLPAFAISDAELPIDGSLNASPPKLPSLWNPIKFFERQRILASGKYLPKVERSVISLYKSPDRLYQFIRDLDVIQRDKGLVAVGQKIEKEIRTIGGRKLLNAVSVAKKVFFW